MELAVCVVWNKKNLSDIYARSVMFSYFFILLFFYFKANVVSNSTIINIDGGGIRKSSVLILWSSLHASLSNRQIKSWNLATVSLSYFFLLHTYSRSKLLLLAVELIAEVVRIFLISKAWSISCTSHLIVS